MSRGFCLGGFGPEDFLSGFFDRVPRYTYRGSSQISCDIYIHVPNTDVLSNL